MRGQSGTVYRAPKRDRHGDPVDENGNPVELTGDGLAKVGVVKGIILGGLSASPSMERRETSDTTGQIGIPRKRNPRVRFGDRIDINGVRYQVVSNPEWDYPHYMTGTDFGMYWVSVRGVIG
ncbi:head-tail connector protein [Mycobacterium phage Kumao]|uniref:Head-to-tail stopper n=1 Tax=Mycobacterium phage Kumao TaxID=2041344 RepID=A0A2D1GPL4_9CAUD|nr:head-tail connector protein [Mycobacterium phage Kumao]ATN93982.1 head-to-tail stopper [Mycobacterium phage Kumao]